MAQVYLLQQKLKRGLVTAIVITVVIVLFNSNILLLPSLTTESKDCLSSQDDVSVEHGANLFKFRRKHLEKICKNYKVTFT